MVHLSIDGQQQQQAMTAKQPTLEMVAGCHTRGDRNGLFRTGLQWSWIGILVFVAGHYFIIFIIITMLLVYIHVRFNVHTSLKYAC